MAVGESVSTRPPLEGVRKTYVFASTQHTVCSLLTVTVGWSCHNCLACHIFAIGVRLFAPVQLYVARPVLLSSRLKHGGQSDGTDRPT